MNNIECKTCKWFVKWSGGKDDERRIYHGACRVAPPSVMPIGEHGGDGGVQAETLWPEPYTASDAPWCGRHEPAPVAAEATPC